MNTVPSMTQTAESAPPRQSGVSPLTLDKQANKLMVYVTAEQRAEIEKAAEDEGLKLSPFMVFCFRQFMNAKRREARLK